MSKEETIKMEVCLNNYLLLKRIKEFLISNYYVSVSTTKLLNYIIHTCGRGFLTKSDQQSELVQTFVSPLLSPAVTTHNHTPNSKEKGEDKNARQQN